MGIKTSFYPVSILKMEKETIMDAEEAARLEQVVLHNPFRLPGLKSVCANRSRRFHLQPVPCSRRLKVLGFTTQRTMRIAQQLYEGSSSRQGLVGLILSVLTLHVWRMKPSQKQKTLSNLIMVRIISRALRKR